MKKTSSIVLVFCLLFALFTSLDANAVTKTYDVVQYGKTIKSFSTLAEAKTYSFGYEYADVVETPGGVIAWTNKPKDFTVYQGYKPVGYYTELDDAVDAASKLTSAYVVDGDTLGWVWDNLANYDVLDASAKSLTTGGYKFLTDAFYFTQSKANAQLKNYKTGEILWKNTTPATSDINASVNANRLNIRSGPSDSYPIVDSVMLNASVTRLTRGGEWEKVKTSTGTTGFAFASFLTTSKATAVTGNGKVVVLDPGHGGHDSGAVGVDGTYEKTVNYNFAVATKAALEAKGYKVYMTRSGDVDCKVPVIDTNAELSCRSKVSSTYKANIFISIHANSEYTGSANGTETYYNANSNYDGHMNASPSKSKLLSDTVHKYIQPAFGSLNRGSKDSSYYVLRFNSVPAILIEVGFMSNTGDLSKMKNASMQQTFANAITKGVDEYFTKGG